ncbi:MAG: sigma 54-interacting transcriptional regulator [Oscillibacter sp.]
MEMDLAGLENLINNTGDALFILAPDGSLLYLNNNMVQLSGYSAEELLSMNTYNLAFTGQMNVHILAQVLKTKRLTTACQKYIRKDGTETPYMLVSQSPVLDEQGNVKYSVGTIRNMENLQYIFQNAIRMTPRLPAGAKVRVQEDFVYESGAMEALIGAVDQVVASDASILILGESGVGKEVLVEYIHRNSPRSGKELVVLNCAALPENLLESELFGYEKGAFTGAQGQGKPGLIELADGGTLFLDEINSMPMALQGKLLRLLETKEVRRLGGIKSKHINFRLLAATNADLKEAIAEKTFRLDLYYRLSVLPFTIPPLRDRKEDIRPLCRHFFSHYEAKYGRCKRLSEKSYRKLEEYSWPGNVRELKNFIERIVLTTDVAVTEIHDIPDELLENSVPAHHMPGMLTTANPPEGGVPSAPPYDDTKSLKENMATYENWVIAKSVAQYGSLTKAAEHLGSSKSTLGRKLQGTAR